MIDRWTDPPEPHRDEAAALAEAAVLEKEGYDRELLRDLESVEAEFTGNPEGVWELREELRLRREDDELVGRWER